MVYRLAEKKAQRRGWYLVPVLVQTGCVCAVALAILSLLVPLNGWLVAAVILMILLVAAPVFRSQLRFINRRFSMLGEQFVTLTESGMMLESPSSGVCSFVPWVCVLRVVQRRGMLVVQQRDGRTHLLPTESLSPERAVAMYEYIRAHARQVTGEPVPPPARLLTPAPLTFGSGRERLLEFAGFLYRQSMPCFSLVCHIFICVLTVCLGVHWLRLGLSGVSLMLLVALVAGLTYLLRPGYLLPLFLRQYDSRQVHVSADGVLVLSSSGAWTSAPLSLFTRARELRHCRVYDAAPLCYVAVDAEAPQVPLLPVPVRQRRWPGLLALCGSLVVVPALVLGGFWCRAEQVEQSAVSSEQGNRLAAYAESFIPPQEYPGSIVHCSVSAEDGTVILFCYWESGLLVSLVLEPQS